MSVTLALDGTGGDGGDGGNDDGGAPPDGGSATSCPAGMVLIQRPSSFCIDAIEVTVAAYNKFLAVPVSSLTVPPQCAGKTDYHPQGACNVGSEEEPIACVDWCCAAAYCTWTGKRLCGALGGGNMLKPSEVDDPKKSEWMYACSSGIGLPYPYGNSYDERACNTGEMGLGRRVVVGTMLQCEGGFEGLFDMTGNVAEWINAYTIDTNYVVMGGDYVTPGAKCSTFQEQAYTNSYPSAYDRIGFRCCK